MTVHHVLYVVLVVVSGVVAATVAGFAWRNRDVVGAVPLAVLMSAVTVWAFAKALELATPGVEATLFWVNVQYVGIVLVPAAWLAFALEYSGRGDWVNRRTVLALAIEPIAVVLISWTNAAHGLFRTSIDVVALGPFTALTSSLGPAFWAHTVYSYLLLAAGTWLILRLVIVSEHLYRWQSIGLLATVVVPWVGNGIALLGLVPRELDPTIVAFTASGFILLWTISRQRLLTLIPAAREVARTELIERMSDAVIVVDDRAQIVDCNPAAQSVLDCPVSTAIGRSLEAVSPPLDDVVREATHRDQDVRSTFSSVNGDAYHAHDVRVSRLYRGRGLLTGWLINVRDVSDQRQREQRLDVMNRLLRHNLRNELNIVVGTASLLRAELESDGQRRRVETIAAAAERMLQRAEKVTEVVSRVNLSDQGPTDVVARVTEVVRSKREEYPAATITTEMPSEAWSSAGPAIATAIEELVTNSLAHTDGSVPAVQITVSVIDSDWGDSTEDGAVRVEVVDAGPGIPEDEVAPIRRGEETPLAHGTGVGLWLVTWIVREAGGNVVFDEVEGRTTVTVSLPVADEP